jgi:hypothetical protein
MLRRKRSMMNMVLKKISNKDIHSNFIKMISTQMIFSACSLVVHFSIHICREDIKHKGDNIIMAINTVILNNKGSNKTQLLFYYSNLGLYYLFYSLVSLWILLHQAQMSHINSLINKMHFIQYKLFLIELNNHTS